MNNKMLLSKLEDYKAYLWSEERSRNTVEKYVRDIKVFLIFLEECEADKEALMEWKKKLAQEYAPASVNSMLAAVNNFFDWLGFAQYKVKPVKIQRNIFTRPEKELTYEEYKRLVRAAQENKNVRLSLLLQTMCATGIRVSELKFITVSAALSGRAIVNCKGKTRTIFLPKEMCGRLRRYCRETKITDGAVFITTGGNPLDRSNIWRDMKALCEDAKVAPGKVFPHNLRHLFARTYYMLEKDLSKLADLLGHSNVETTRIYTTESGTNHQKQLDRMRLVLREEIITT